MRGLCMMVKIAALLPIMGIQGFMYTADRKYCREALPVQFYNDVPRAVSNGSCVFKNTLCSYSQGCADPSMSNWTQRWEYASASQTTPSHHEDWTILVSPLLDMSQDCCVTVNYNLYGNASMDAFWEGIGSQRAVALIRRKEQEFQPIKVFTETATIGTSAGSPFGRIKIRAKATGAKSAVFLFAISLREGRCGGQSCSFNEDLCGWREKNWTRTSRINSNTTIIQDRDNPSLGHFVRLNAHNGRLTTPTIRVTSGLRDCVRFLYIVWGNNIELEAQVYVLEADGTGLQSRVWRHSVRRSDVSPSWKTGVFPVTVRKYYKIRFVGRQERNDASAIVALDRVIITTESAHAACKFEPPDAETRERTLLTTLPTAPSTTPRIRSVHTSSSHSPISTEKDGSSTSIGMMGGSVAGAVVLIVLVVIIIACLVWRRRKNKRKSQGQIGAEYDECSPTEGNGTRLSTKNDAADSTDIPNSGLLPAPDADTYTDIDDIDISPQINSSSGRRSKGDGTPHELTDDACARSTPHPPNPRTNKHLTPVAQQSEENLYNHISSCGSAPKTTRGSSSDNYHHIDTPRNPSQRLDKNPSARKSAGARETTPAANSSQSYSSVRKQSSLVTSSSRTGGENHEAICDLPRTSLPRSRHEDAGDYNTLHFDRLGAERAEGGDHGHQAQNLYDHVLSGPDDIYNTTRTGTRDVIVDSTYDHVKL